MFLRPSRALAVAAALTLSPFLLQAQQAPKPDPEQSSPAAGAPENAPPSTQAPEQSSPSKPTPEGTSPSTTGTTVPSNPDTTAPQQSVPDTASTPAQSNSNGTTSNAYSSTAGDTDSASPAGTEEARQMVPARAELLKALDAKQLQPGAAFEAKLTGKVHLANGPELPSGTILKGQVAADDMNVSGSSKLALQFTSAQLKDGQSVPIKATIVGLYPHPDDSESGDESDTASVPNTWNRHTLQIDQLGVTGGVDLHSKVASQNSGVFVATSRDDVRLNKGMQLSLAIASGATAGQQGQPAGY